MQYKFYSNFKRHKSESKIDSTNVENFSIFLPVIKMFLVVIFMVRSSYLSMVSMANLKNYLFGKKMPKSSYTVSSIGNEYFLNTNADIQLTNQLFYIHTSTNCARFILQKKKIVVFRDETIIYATKI